MQLGVPSLIIALETSIIWLIPLLINIGTYICRFLGKQNRSRKVSGSNVPHLLCNSLCCMSSGYRREGVLPSTTLSINKNKSAEEPITDNFRRKCFREVL